MTWAKDLNKYFVNGNKHVKRCSTSSVIEEMELKPQWDTSTHPLEGLTLTTLTVPSVGKDVEQL